MNAQISDVLKTMATLKQWFTKVMDHLPTTSNQMPAHKKLKGWMLSINAYQNHHQNTPPLGYIQQLIQLQHQPQQQRLQYYLSPFHVKP